MGIPLTRTSNANGMKKIKIFDQSHFILEIVQDRGVVTMEGE